LGGADEFSVPPISSAVARATRMIATGAGFMMRGALVTTEHAPVGLYGIAGTDDANAVGAGALYHFNNDTHFNYSSLVGVGFQDVFDHVGEHRSDVAIRQIVKHVLA